jgi:hypothetical protein
MSERNIGTAMKPAAVKCCSIGRTGRAGGDYASFVLMDGREVYLQLREGIELLLLHQLREPAESA